MTTATATLIASIACGALAGDGGRRILERSERRQLILGANELLVAIAAAAGFLIGMQSGLIAH